MPENNNKNYAAYGVTVEELVFDVIENEITIEQIESNDMFNSKEILSIFLHV